MSRSFNSGSTGPARPRRPRPDDALVAAGLRLFSSYGLRRTSMEALAREAGVAKATAYTRFRDKAAVFEAVCAAVAADLEHRAATAAAAESAPRDAVRASLVAKFVRMAEILHASNHGKELLEASGELAGAAMTRAHRRYVGQLAVLLERCGVVEAPRALAEVLDAAAEGIVARARTARGVRAQLGLLIERVLR